MAPPLIPDRTETLAPRDRGVDPAGATALPDPLDGDDDAADAAVAMRTADDPDRYAQVVEHARGGLGRVLRAVDRRLGRTVAVKELLRRGHQTEARFIREAMITARLEHPGIVPVHEAGRWPNGDPYYVMKLVEGRTLKELILERRSLRERLGLLPHVIAIADAVGYAHSEGVIHRDLKPSNVIVGGFGETIVVDWGLARDRKRNEPDACEELLLAAGSGCSTVSGKVVGTPAYMSPEQARGDAVDERADVYAIGAVLYELLAGAPPHTDDTPQATLDRVIAGPPCPLPAVVAHLPGELAAIVAKAMAREPDARYPNATALAEDLRRFSTGKLVSAHAYTTWSILRKKIAQHRGMVAMAVASALALGALGIESFRRVVAERNIAQTERSRAETALEATRNRQQELVLLNAETSLRKDPTATLAWLKQYAVDDGHRAQVVDVIDEAVALGVARHVFRPGDWVFDAMFTPDGSTLVTAVRDGAVRAYDLANGTETVLGKAASAPELLALSPDGKLAITGNAMGEVWAWPLPRGAGSRLLSDGAGRAVTAFHFSPDGERLLVERALGAYEIIALGGEVVHPVGPEAALRWAVAAANWDRAVVTTSANQFSALDGNNTNARALGHTDKAIVRIGLSPSGGVVLVHDGEQLWSVPFGGGALKPFARYAGLIRDVAWSPDEHTVAICGDRYDILLVDVVTGKTRELRGHTDAIYTVEWSRDGRRLLSASDDATARVWTVADGTSTVLRGHDDDVYRARFSADERQVVTASLDGTSRVWSLDEPSVSVLAEGDEVKHITIDGDDALVTTSTTVARWDLARSTREPLFSWAQEPRTFGLAMPSPDGEQLLVPGPSWSMEVRRRQGPPVQLRGHGKLVSRTEFSRDGSSLYSSSFDGTLRRWDLATGKDTTLLSTNTPIRGFAVGGDGRAIALLGGASVLVRPDGTTEELGHGAAWCLWNVEFERVRDRAILHRCDQSLALYDGTHVTELPTGGFFAVRMVVSADGRLVAGAMNDRTVRVWDAATGEVLHTLRGHSDLVLDLAFSPDGEQLASASYDKTIRIWQLASKRHRVLRGHAAAVDAVAWRDGRHLVTGSRDGTLREWDVPALELPTSGDIASRLDAATTAHIDGDRATSEPPATRGT